MAGKMKKTTRTTKPKPRGTRDLSAAGAANKIRRGRARRRNAIDAALSKK